MKSVLTLSLAVLLALSVPALAKNDNGNGKGSNGNGNANGHVKGAPGPLVGAGDPGIVVAMDDFVFQLNLVAVVRVRAADKSDARAVVPLVLGAPGSTEIALANQNNVLVGHGAAVTGVDFSMVGPIKSSKFL